MGTIKKIKLLVTDFIRKIQTNMADVSTANFPCNSIRQFKESLKRLRLMDDKIIYELNKREPTQSFKHEVDAEEKCRCLYNDLLEIYTTRDTAIKGCISKRTDNISTLREKVKENGEDSGTMKDLRSEQVLLKQMQSELIVEEVVKKRSLKVFNERCWQSYQI